MARYDRRSSAYSPARSELSLDFYSDFSSVNTGEIPEQSCEALGAGQCAVNCPCDPVEDPIWPDVIERCQFLSEDHPVGLCVGQKCSDDSDCSISGAVCAHVAMPEWAQEYTAVANERASILRPVVPGPRWTGFCTMKSTCEAWAAANPGVVTRCGD